MSKPLRRILLFFLWTYLYAGFCYLFFLWVFNFNIFKVANWTFLYTQFVDLEWVISDPWDVFFVFSVILIPLLWGIGLYFFIKVNWIKKLKNPFANIRENIRRRQLIKMAKEGKIQIAKPTSSASLRPQKLRTAGSLTDFSFLEKEQKENGGRSDILNPTSENGKEKTENHSRQEQEDVSIHNGPSSVRTSLQEEEIGRRESSLEISANSDAERGLIVDKNAPVVFQKARELASSLGFSVFENVKTQESILSFVISYDERAWAFDFLIEPTTEWIADEEEFDGEAPVWFTDKAQITSPFYMLCKDSLALEKEAEAPVQPVLVVAAGNILNVQNCLPVWKEKGGAVVRFMQGKPAELPTLEDYLKEEIQKVKSTPSSDLKPTGQKESTTENFEKETGEEAASAVQKNIRKKDEEASFRDEDFEDDIFEKDFFWDEEKEKGISEKGENTFSDDDFFDDADLTDEEKELLKIAKEIK